MDKFLTYEHIKSNENTLQPITIEVLGSKIFEKACLLVDAIGMPINFCLKPNYELVN